MMKGNCSLYEHNATWTIVNIYVVMKAENGNVPGHIFVFKEFLLVDNKVE